VILCGGRARGETELVYWGTQRATQSGEGFEMRPFCGEQAHALATPHVLMAPFDTDLM
jgi:hypothetical protein